jgi:hypothetical protein
MILRKIGPYVVEQAPEGMAVGRDADKDRRGRLVFAAAAAAVAVASHVGGAPLPFVVMVSASAAFAAMQSFGAGRSPSRMFLSRDCLRLRRGDPSDDLVWPKEKIRRVVVEEGRSRGLRHTHRQTGPRWCVRVEIDGAENALEYAFATREGADEMAAFVAGELGVPVED